MEVSTRKSYFIEEEDDNGLATSLSEMEAYSYKKMNHYNYYVSSPRSAGKYYDFRFDNNNSFFGHHQQQQPLAHFLDSCSLCKKRLDNRDIFMYRGDTPFCSEECREEQIKKDEAKEKKQSLSSSMKAMRRKEKRRSSSSSSPTRSRDYAFHTAETVAAA